jgi:nucleoid DNA-binding protein
MSKGSKKKTPNITKAQLISSIADRTNLTKTQVTNVFQALEEEIQKALHEVDGEINILSLLKIRKVRQKAKPARQGRNPATGEAMTIKAKPAGDVVRVRILKGLKEMIIK